MKTLELTDAPAFIYNVGETLTVVLSLLHELKRDAIRDTELASIDRAISILSITQDACEWTVRDIEAGYKLQRKEGAA